MRKVENFSWANQTSLLTRNACGNKPKVVKEGLSFKTANNQQPTATSQQNTYHIQAMVFEPSRYQDRRTWKMTPAMIRARQPFFKKNLAGLLVLVGITGGIYAYTYRFLNRDNDFADVPIPPIDEKELEKLKKEYELEKLKRKGN